MDSIHQTPVVRRLDNAIHLINRYLVEPRYPLVSDLSGGPVIQPSNSRGLDVKKASEAFAHENNT